uniref:Protein alan shepard n=1 Tax=Acrobeloides nanus TaxID=290746 RepID=A0A914C7V4_9BILA
MSTDSNEPQPDPDTIKMFVGQIPRSWDEAECRLLFEEYGPVFHLNILVDRETKTSRGCCFVTYFHRKDAIAAQNALHNLRVLPGMIHPVQMKPADGENRNERKLFVGMLNRNMNEDDVRKLFAQNGPIEECTVLREDGRSRGCAFVTFVSRHCALKAIKQMHHSQTFEGCTKPIVVKFADTQKDKVKGQSTNQSASPGDQNVMLQQLLQQQNRSTLAPAASPTLLTNQLAGLGALLQNPGIINLLGLGGASSSSAPLQLQQQQLQALQAQQMLEMLKQQSSPDATTSPGIHGLNIPHSMASSQSANLFQLPNSAEFLQNNLAGISQFSALNQLKTMTTAYNPLNLAAAGSGLLPSGAASLPTSNSKGGGDIAKGPDGCNLFIYHLPQDFTDLDLYTLFKHFGNVLSAKVFIDKQTNLSKCFGFVSFDNALSAKNAISGMNGFAIGSKRLKVQLKGKKDGKPYDQQPSNSPGSVQAGYV